MKINVIQNWNDYPANVTFRAFSAINTKAELERIIAKYKPKAAYWCESKGLAYLKLKDDKGEAIEDLCSNV
jgi:hypothetical protein